jgi:hypothetical protein
MNNKLLKINDRQLSKFIELGFEVTSDTLVLEGLKFFRDKIDIYVKVNVGLYFVSEIYKFNETIWHSHGVHSWEDAESLALNYLLQNYENGVFL